MSSDSLRNEVADSELTSTTTTDISSNPDLALRKGSPIIFIVIEYWVEITFASAPCQHTLA